MDNTFNLPKVGQTVIIRNRPGVVRNLEAVDVSDGPQLHYLEVEYIDGWLHPESEQVIWQLESNCRIISRLSLPTIDHPKATPDLPGRFKSFINAFLWSATNRFPEEGESEENQVNLISPWHNAVQIEDYQIYPVLKSLLMPRISLLLADDVGLGKTIEAGLIISELFSRRRARRVMVLCPASLQNQWQEELRDKFHLNFEIVDRDKLFYLQRTLGVDSNPWVTYPRLITSMDYLRQPDVLESFMAASKAITGKREGVLPWQVLIVDEAHNLAPKSSREESDRCRMLRQLGRLFEHKLFLTATPHNGYTFSFTGLLELLDPVRFQKKFKLEESDHAQIHVSMIRRLKSELDDEPNGGRFPKREVKALDIPSNDQEKQLFVKERKLFDTLRQYRSELRKQIGPLGRRERNISDFLSTLLAKRLLSSSFAFACTWWQHVAGLDFTRPSEEEVDHIIKKATAELTDDEEKGAREEDAARQSGAWLLQYEDKLKPHMEAVGRVLEELGLSADQVSKSIKSPSVTPPDTKWERLYSWIRENLFAGNKFKPDERLIVFTEYKNTLDYLISRFQKVGLDAPQVEKIFGGAGSAERKQRELIKAAFNDPESPLRILVATDVASEGINLQNTCRYVVHYDVPWNPMRLEQRNGRVDRHGQARDVFVYHFNTDDEADIKLLAHVVKKVNQAREDLGSVSQVLDQAIIQHFTQQEIDPGEIDRRTEAVQKDNLDREDMQSRDRGMKESMDKTMQRLEATQLSMGLTPERLADLLACCLQMEGGSLTQTHEKGVYRISDVPASWRKLVKETLEIKEGRLQGSLPKLVFDPSFFERRVNGRKIYKTEKDKALIRLGHPLMRRALSTLKRKLWDPPDFENPSVGRFSRWTVVKSPLPRTVDRLLILHILLEVTNELREYVHEEVLQTRFNAKGNSLVPLEDSLWEEIRHLPRCPLSSDDLDSIVPRIKDQWISYEQSLESYVESLKTSFQSEFESRMKDRLKSELPEERKRFESRLKELEKQPKWLERQNRELERQRARLQQVEAFPQYGVEERQRLEELTWELHSSHVTQMKNIIESEKTRILNEVLPKRYSLAHVELFPLAVEFIIREST